MAIKIIILGAGPGGYVAAIRAAQLGAEVAVIEKDNVGGTCLNWGCIPSKVMKTTADMFENFKRAAQFGIRNTGSVHPDMARLATRKETVIKNQAQGILKLFKQHEIHYLRGNGIITGPGIVSVTRKEQPSVEVKWDKLIIATGTKPHELQNFPFDGKRIISSNDALYMETLPESLFMLGGGVVGCEFASIFSALGCRVTLVEAMDRLLPLPSLDEDCSKVLRREMKKRKVNIFLNQTASFVENSTDTLRITLTPTPGAKANKITPATVETAQMLVCIGRRPCTSEIGLGKIGVAKDDHGWVTTNEKMETNIEHVYAIGDVLGPSKIMLAHVASAEGIVAAENALGGSRLMDYSTVPSAIFTSPEVAGVGITESQAKAQGYDVRSDTVLFRTIGKAHIMGEIAGQAKIVSSTDTGKILGVHIIGPHAADLIAEATLAIQMNATTRDLAETIHAHPTLAEVMMEVSHKALNMSIHG